MILIAVLVVGLIAAAYGFVSIEKQRGADGTLTYPLWRCNLLLFWLMATLVCLLVIGGTGLPRFIGIALHPAQGKALVTAVSKEEHCRVSYRYQTANLDHTGSDVRCGIKEGEEAAVYYDRLAPQSATLYLPERALENELTGVTIASVALGALIVLWFRVTHIVGGWKKP